MLLNQLGWGEGMREAGAGAVGGEGGGGSSVTLLFRPSCGTAVAGASIHNLLSWGSVDPHGSCFPCELHPVETETGLPYTKLKYPGWGVKSHSNSAKKTL